MSKSLKELIQCISILDIISEHVEVKDSGTRKLCVCPFHNDTKPSLLIEDTKGCFYCFGCRTSGDVITFLMKINNMTFTEVLDYLRERYNLPLTHKKRDYTQELDTLRTVNTIYLQQQDRAVQYLATRDISRNTVQYFHIGFASEDQLPLDDHELYKAGLINKKNNNIFQNRVTFPIIDKHKNTRGFTARSIKQQDNYKYVNSPNTHIFDKSSNIYGEYQWYQHSNSSIIIVEGALDVLSLFEQGWKNAVAILGSFVTTYQAKLISKMSKNIYLMLDGDQLTKDNIIDCIISFISFSSNNSLKIVQLGCDKDPASTSKEGILHALNTALCYKDFVLQFIKQKELSHATDIFRKISEHTPNTQAKINLLGSISQLLGLSLDDLYKLATRRQHVLDQAGVHIVDKAIFAIIYYPKICSIAAFKNTNILVSNDDQEYCNCDMLHELINVYDSDCSSSYLLSFLRSQFSSSRVDRFCKFKDANRGWALDFSSIMNNILLDLDRKQKIQQMFTDNNVKK